MTTLNSSPELSSAAPVGPHSRVASQVRRGSAHGRSAYEP